MKKYILPFMSIAMLMAMASCSSSDDEVAEIKEESKLVPMTFTATQESNTGTRSALNGSNGVDWQAGDEISVFDGTGAGCNQRFTLTGDVETGKFSGNASPTATKFTAVYPYTGGAQLESDGIVSGITLPAEQTAIAGSFDPKAALMMAYTEDKSKLDFKNAVSLVKVTTQFACKKIVLTADVDIAGTGTLKMTFNSANDTYTSSFTFSSGKSNTITLKPATGEYFDAGTYYIVVPPITLTNGFSISFHASDEYCVYTRKSTRSNTFNRSMIKNFGTFKKTENGWDWSHTSRGKVDASQEVDLGLTITKEDGKKYRVIFAKSNLKGNNLAANEYDYGDYFAWGATEPWCTAYTRTVEDGEVTVTATAWGNSKAYDTYSWTTVPFSDGENNQCNEYTSEGEVLDMEYDAANVILGGDWQLPTKEIWVNLYNTSNYNWERTTKDDYNGYQVTSKTDKTKTLFLPAAGFVEGTSFSNVGSYGLYWSGTANSSTHAYRLHFYDIAVFEQGNSFRFLGFPVRPVRLVAVSESQQ